MPDQVFYPRIYRFESGEMSTDSTPRTKQAIRDLVRQWDHEVESAARDAGIEAITTPQDFFEQAKRLMREHREKMDAVFESEASFTRWCCGAKP